MPFENEIKIALNDVDFKRILTFCQRKGEHRGKILQIDEYFDTKDELLKKEDFTVRLRKINDRFRLALKGPRMFTNHNTYKRIELEFSIYAEEEVRAQLVAQSLIQVAKIEKKRNSFILNNCVIALDVLPFIGSFIEIENENPNKIKSIVTILQLPFESALKENYTEILEKKLSELGLPLRPKLEATFKKYHKAKGVRS